MDAFMNEEMARDASLRALCKSESCATLLGWIGKNASVKAAQQVGPRPEILVMSFHFAHSILSVAQQ